MNIIKEIVIVSGLLLCGCNLFTTQNNKEKASEPISLEVAEQKILALSVTQKAERYISNSSGGKRGISLLPNDVTIDNKSFYEIQIGYMSPIRFETYHTLYVNKMDADDIRILDAVSGEIIAISDYKEVEADENKPKEQLIEQLDVLKKIVKSSEIVDSRLYKIDKDNILIAVDHKDEKGIYIHLYRKNDVSDNPNQPQIVNATVAWLLLDSNTYQLFDITDDPENPKELKYNSELIRHK